MKRSTRSAAWAGMAAVVTAIAGLATTVSAGPVTDEFTYQGDLSSGGLPANGSYDFRFRLYDASIFGLQVGGQIARTATVTDGKFTTALQFPGAFTGSALWLEIDVSPAGAGSFTTLAPRQALLASPNAAWAITAGTATNATSLGGQPGSFYTNASNMSTGTLPSARLSGAYSSSVNLSNAANSFTGSGAGLTGLNGSAISTGTVADLRLTSNVALLNSAQSFTAVKTFTVAPAFSAAGAPFSVTGTTVVPNLNADMVDGQHASAFSLTGHTHIASDVTSGTFADARLSTNVALLNAAQTFTAIKTFNANAIFNSNVAIGTASPVYPLHIVDTGGIAAYVNNDGSASVPYGFYSQVNGTSSKYGFYADVNGNVSGTGYGLYINNETLGGRGVYAAMTSGVGSSAYGFYTTNSSETGRGLSASMTGSGLNYGVYVSNSSDAGYGGYFNNTSTTGTTYGLYCENNSTSGYGLYALHDAATGTGPAVYARSDSTSSSAYALHAIMNSTTPGASSAAVRAQNSGTNSSGYGIYASHAGGGYGGYFFSDSGYGVYSNGGSTIASIYGYNPSTGSGVRGYSVDGYGGYFDTGVSGGAALYVVGTASVGVLTIRGGADLAENFEVKTAPEAILPGMVVMIDDEHAGAMEIAVGAYNRRVAGVVSGANELAAGMVLGQFDGQQDSKPVALTGRVWTYVDASDRAVEPGDLLTTSATPGYAMPVVDDSRAHGATIGKAMSRLDKGEKGLVLVLVNLQ